MTMKQDYKEFEEAFFAGIEARHNSGRGSKVPAALLIAGYRAGMTEHKRYPEPPCDCLPPSDEDEESGCDICCDNAGDRRFKLTLRRCRAAYKKATLTA